MPILTGGSLLTQGLDTGFLVTEGYLYQNQPLIVPTVAAITGEIIATGSGTYLAGKPCQVAFGLKSDLAFNLSVVTATVLDSTGTPVTGSPFAVAATALTPAHWLLLFFWTPATAGAYRIEYNVTYPQGPSDTFHRGLEVVTEPSTGDLASYDAAAIATNTVYQTRWWMQDTDMTSPVWSDAEISYLLALSATSSGQVADGNPLVAASYGLEQAATRRAKLSIVLKLGLFGRDSAKAVSALQAEADRLRAIALSGASVVVTPNDASLQGLTQFQNWPASTVPTTQQQLATLTNLPPLETW